jgi:hypothetical protein
MAFPSTTGPNSYIWNLKQVYNARLGDNWPTPFPFPGARGVFAGGVQAPATGTNVIDYITIQSTGNATDFGDLTNTRSASCGASSQTRLVSCSGDVGAPSYTQTNVLDYVTIASTGNAIDFGDDFAVSSGTSGAASNNTRGLFAGGYAPSRNTNTIRYITIASVGNTTDFGDLTVGRYQIQTAINSSTRAVWAGGNT